MSNLEQLILEIEKISGELEPPGSLRNEYLLSVNEYISNFINDIESAAAYSDEKINREILSLSGVKRSLSDLLKT